ncbi:MAG: efflux transporter outer membrane subunit [Desulfobulbales bacterium]|nr:efflux transporter outer membrane subunit [Desulfobulbales bacterium]
MPLILGVVLISVVITSCTPFAPAARQGQEEISLPDTFSVNQAINIAELRWWETFADDQLNSLVAQALSENLTLASYWARLDKARLQAKKAGADLLPAVTGEGGASYMKMRSDDGTTVTRSENDNYSIGLVASYEIDLWGRVRASRESARLEAEASREDLHAAAITVAAEVTERWVKILSQKFQLQLLEQQLETNRVYFDLVELRFRKSLASALDVLQQKQLLERIRAQLPLVEMEERIQRNQLAVLLGRMVHELPEVTRAHMPELPDVPAAGLPVQLLQNRPDIAAALKRLEAADQTLAAARADRLPSLRLTGSGAYGSGDLERIFDNWMVNLAGSLTAPIFDGGSREAEVGISAAEIQQNLVEYRHLVITAVREVEDALITETKTRDHIKALKNQLQAARDALNEARSRYINGLNDYLPVLTQLLSVQGLESDLIRKQADLIVTRVDLYRAIGGTWPQELVSPEGEN